MYEAVKTNINKSYAYTCTDYDPLDYCKKGEMYDVYIKDGLAYISPCHSVCVMDEEGVFFNHLGILSKKEIEEIIKTMKKIMKNM